MRKLLTQLFVNALSLWVIDFVMSSVYISTPTALVGTALILVILNAALKPVLQLVSLPVTFLTLGLFALFINAFVLELAFSFVSGSYIAGFSSAVWASILLSIVNSALNSIMD